MQSSVLSCMRARLAGSRHAALEGAQHAAQAERHACREGAGSSSRIKHTCS